MTLLAELDFVGSPRRRLVLHFDEDRLRLTLEEAGNWPDGHGYAPVSQVVLEGEDFTWWESQMDYMKDLTELRVMGYL